VQSLGASASGLGDTLGEACEVLGELEGWLAEVAGLGPHAAIPHATRTTSVPYLAARAGSRLTHAKVLVRSAVEPILCTSAGRGKRGQQRGSCDDGRDHSELETGTSKRRCQQSRADD